jgi:hypothetical protein
VLFNCFFYFCKERSVQDVESKKKKLTNTSDNRDSEHKFSPPSEFYDLLDDLVQERRLVTALEDSRWMETLVQELLTPSDLFMCKRQVEV